MSCTLVNHPNQYSLSLWDAGVSLSHGLSGAPYAYRHWELGHRVIAVLEHIPIVGLLAAIVERIVVFVASCFCCLKTSLPPSPSTDSPENPETTLVQSPFRDRPITIEEAQEKMLKNARKALEKHQAKEPNGYASREHALPSLEQIQQASQNQLDFIHGSAAEQGHRKAMEDAEFYKEMDSGILTGVFDGHGGSAVSKYASDKFEKRFPTILKKAGGNVHLAFETLIHEIHKGVAKRSKWDDQGTTAVICYIDKKTSTIYTATLGDSEANIYRKIDGKRQSIPLSCVRDWWGDKAMKRLCKAHNITKEAIMRIYSPNDKELRSKPSLTNPDLRSGVNVARAIGDVSQTGSKKKPIVIHKPKITVNKLQKGDILTLVCDGVKDFVSEKRIVNLVSKHRKEEANALAQEIVDYAYNEGHSTDNITALVVKIA